MSQHRSPSSNSHRNTDQPTPHKSYRRPTRRRSKALVVAVVALSLSGAASLAHANFGKGQLGGNHKAEVEASGAAVATWNDVNLRRWWPTSGPTTGWPKPRPTSAPTTTQPTKAPSTSTPTTSTPTTSSPTSQPPSQPPAGSRQWPGQIPGKFVLGMSCADACDAKGKAVGSTYGVHRQFYQWGNWSGMAKDIQADHKAGRMPWLSVKPPSNGASGWQKVSGGSVDAAIRDLATMLKANDDDPILITFHHEPSNDGTEADGKLWAAAYSHFHDVLKAQGALANVSDPPILGDWLFNPVNKKQDPANWALDNVLSRAPFMGIDLYQNASGKTMADRIPIILDYLKAHGYPKMMVGIGETGATDMFSGTTAAKWMDASFSWVAANTDKVGVVSYFNSTNNSKATTYWPLDESAAKLATYRKWLGNAKVAPTMP